MLDYTLSIEQLAELRAAHRRTRGQREANHIKVVVSLAGGWPAEQVAEVLLIDSNTVRDNFRRYTQANAKFSVSSPTGYFKILRQQGAQVALVLTRVTEEVCADFAKPAK